MPYNTIQIGLLVTQTLLVLFQGVTLVAVILNLVVARREAVSASRAADAALKATEISLEQSKLLERQVEISKRQMVEQLRPVILMDQMIRIDGKIRATLKNQGGGAAFNITPIPSDDPSFRSSSDSSRYRVLGAGRKMVIQGISGETSSVVFLYRSTFGEAIRTEVLISEDKYANYFYPDAASESSLPKFE